MSVDRRPFDLTVLVADALVAAAEDAQLPLSRVAAMRIANRLVDHLAVLGFRIEAQR